MTETTKRSSFPALGPALGRAFRRGATYALSAPVHAYRYMLSPLLPRSCRFHPSCSSYALEALHTHGPVKGSWLTLKRLSRCHPVKILGGSSGFDPVPPSADAR